LTDRRIDRPQPTPQPAAPEEDAGEAGDVHVLYIAGIGRSGSTLLCRTLGAIDGFLGTGELMRIFSRGVTNGDLCGCGAPVSACGVWRPVLAELHRREPQLDPARLENIRRRLTEGWPLLRYYFLPSSLARVDAEANELRRFLAAFYRSVRAATGARVIVDASKNMAFARLLTETPGIRVSLVHLVRDSRGVAYSLRRRRRRPGTNGRQEHFTQHGPVLASSLWTMAQLMTEPLRRHASRYLRVRYEDFVSAPSTAIERILEFAGEPVRRPLGHVNGESVSLGAHHLIASNPNRERRGEIRLHEDVAWRRAMPHGSKYLVTALTLPLLRRYGYRIRPGEEVPRTPPSRSSATATR